ncbi:porin [Marinobacterium sediminicola]|uniref:Porin n=1 Tax=Marinobacterium sediminicola TaxID=518898 RepID=A0ABY1RZ32_9GAMM|nr:porin [Marinobacterium sediminicola]ULG68028.1 porin [Marinobacterium sediminicola]SMR73462.1 porin [Marinobacterium sediminicola]
MKKLLAACTLLATAAPACAVPIADTGIDVYGSLRIMLEQKKDSDDTEYKDASSRVGIKGAYALDEYLSAFAKYEVALDLGNDGDTVGDMRYGHIGLTDTRYGTLALGKVDSPFYEAVGVAADYMWWNSAPVYYTLDGVLRVRESVYYSSPDLNGVKLKALYQVDDEDNTHQEQTQLGATYSTGNLTLGAAYTGTEGGDDLYGLSAYYSGEGFYINGAYLDRENAGKGIDAILGIPSGKNLYTLGLSEFSADDNSGDFTAAILAYQRTLHEKVLVWAEFMAWDGSLYGVEDSNQLNVGINFNF